MEARRSTRHPVQRPMHGSAVGLPWPRRSGRRPTPRARGVARLATLSMPWRQSSPGSRPSCGARAIAQAKACPDLAIASWRTPSPPTHFRSVRANRRRVRAVVLTAGAVVAVGSTASLVTRDAQEASGARLDSRSAAHRTPASLDVLASHPLSTRAAERQLERGSLRGATTTALPHAARRFDPGQRTPSGAAASATPAAP